MLAVEIKLKNASCRSHSAVNSTKKSAIFKDYFRFSEEVAHIMDQQVESGQVVSLLLYLVM